MSSCRGGDATYTTQDTGHPFLHLALCPSLQEVCTDVTRASDYGRAAQSVTRKGRREVCRPYAESSAPKSGLFRGLIGTPFKNSILTSRTA